MLDIEKEMKLTKETFINLEGDFAPLARFDREGEPSVIALLNLEGRNKWEVMAALAKEHQATRVVFMADSWMRSTTKEGYDYQMAEGLRVRDMPDRTEVLIVTIITADDVEYAHAPYHWKGKQVVWDEAIDLNEGTIESAGADLVQEALRANA